MRAETAFRASADIVRVWVWTACWQSQLGKHTLDRDDLRAQAVDSFLSRAARGLRPAKSKSAPTRALRGARRTTPGLESITAS